MIFQKYSICGNTVENPQVTKHKAQVQIPSYSCNLFTRSESTSRTEANVNRHKIPIISP